MDGAGGEESGRCQIKRVKDRDKWRENKNKDNERKQARGKTKKASVKEKRNE